MRKNDDFFRLADAIARIFQERIILDDDVLHFIDSTCCAGLAEQISLLLNDPGHIDHEMISALVFSPDESIQSILEPYVENIKPENVDPDALAAHILAQTQTATVHLPQQKQSFCMPIDFAGVTHFLSRLNLQAAIDPKIADAMNRYRGLPFFWPAKVKLRNARGRHTEEQIAWMVLFLTSVNCREDEFLEFLEFALEFVNHISIRTDILNTLRDMQKRYFNALKQSGEYEARLSRTNMETMIAMGSRMPYVDRHDAVRKIYMIDHLCAGIYGRAEEIGQENNLFTIFTGSGNY